MASVESLAATFDRPDGTVRVVTENGLPAVRLTSPSSAASALIYLHGAHVASWTDAAGTPLLYMSPTAIYNGKKALRGGVPLCWPQFGPGALPQHGFARTSAWTLVATAAEGEPAGGARSATFCLGSSAATRDVGYPADWVLTYTVSLQPTTGTLSLRLAVAVAAGSPPAPLTAALHTYFAVDAAAACAVHGLGGLTYRNTAEGGREEVEAGDTVTVGSAEVDRVYLDVPSTVTLSRGGTPGGAVRMRTKNFPDAVVWNPYKAKAASLADMPDDGWERFVCVEAVAVKTPVTVPGGGEWVGEVVLESVPAA